MSTDELTDMRELGRPGDAWNIEQAADRIAALALKEGAPEQSATVDAAIARRAPQAQGDGVVEAHPDDAAVDRFAAVMATKLAKKREDGRGGWEDKEQCSNALLSRLLREHVEKGDPVDVANLAMMIHQRGEAIALSGAAPQAVNAHPYEDFNAAINFAVDQAGYEAATFLRSWREGDWARLDDEWPEWKSCMRQSTAR